MGAFELIEERRFQEFCDLYETYAHLRAKNSDFRDLMPGNYITALLGTKNYHKLVEFCLEQMDENANRKSGPDRSSAKNFIACSIGFMELQQYDNAIAYIKAGSSSKYQDLARTQVPSIMYYEAVMLADKKSKQTSQKMLNARLRKEESSTVDFAIAKFLVGRCTSDEMLVQIDSFSPIMRERRKVQALFYMAIKEFEAGNREKYYQYLAEAYNLYDECHSITLEFEYYLTEICLSKKG